MLVLNRKKGERIVFSIGDERVILDVLDVGGGRVSLGFIANRDLRIDREEKIKPIVRSEK